MAILQAKSLICQQKLCNKGDTGDLGPTGPTGVAGPTGATPTTVSASYYSNTTQPIVNGTPTYTAPTIFTYNGTFVQHGVTLASSSRITVGTAGTYEAWYSIQLNRTSGGSNTFVYFWIRLNGADVPDSNGRVAINSNNAQTLPIVPYILDLAAGDYIEFVAVADGDNCEAQASYPAPSPFGAAIPSIPSIIVGIKKI